MTEPSAATVLVVDDDDMVRQVTSLLLRSQGYQVLEATNGREAVDRVAGQTDAIDAVLLDVMMPVMTGHEAFPLLRESVPDLPIVFFSGYDQSEVAVHLAEPGAYTSFVPKPFQNEALFDEIARAIASR